MRNIKKSVHYYYIDRIMIFHNIHNKLLILYIIWTLDRLTQLFIDYIVCDTQ